ncbi:MAG: bifunctional adenosylcobinamide kinase/adenosylcobinamide-phosphate guanylyltransferase [Hyphomicrobiales bacterium]|nr:bifunctional adenosylcobinamide kinase/adenosylcobinamide-phosphate guanylyltransferase [Hyphomicrobiales bacterium]MDE2115535.1 bifunctional adenosylcobinamide kinase/adenosylcobinamide-phosphate guanylyltransferase [Hyphomicrobiales bacterium]
MPIPALTSLLVMGGAKSGKTAFAQHLAESAGLQPVYIATAQAFDGEMTTRIARHKAARGSQWSLLEEPLELAQIITEAAHEDRILLVDCATLWLSNWMLAGRDTDAGTDVLAQALAKVRGPVIMVSNEVGHAIVPDNALARAFVDAQGHLNQALARASEGVVQVVAGLPYWLKPAPSVQMLFRSRA